MLKNLIRASAIALSFAMAIQFNLADTYYANTIIEEAIIEEHTQDDPVTVEETMPVLHMTEDIVQVSEPKSVTLSYVAEDGTILKDVITHEQKKDYRLDLDADDMLNFDGYILQDVVMNGSQKVTAAQASLNVTSDLNSFTFVYQKVQAEKKTSQRRI